MTRPHDVVDVGEEDAFQGTAVASASCDAELGPATSVSLSDVSGRGGVDGNFRDAVQIEGFFDG
jgi:hypothetical protein